MMKMKKRVAVVLLFALCLAQIPVAPKAKTKKVKLNLTKVSLLQGATVKLKLLNKKAGAVKWYSKNKKKATVTKKGKVTAKKTGNVVVYAKYKKKQYKCKVMVKASVNTANLKENNAVFTKTVYKRISKIQRLVVKQEVISPKGIYEIYQLLAAMDIQEITNSSSEKFVGGISLELQFNDGTKFDSSYDRGEPLEFVCGAGMMIKGFDEAVKDMEVGQIVNVHLMPEEAYGMPDPQNIFTIALERLPGAETLEAGQQVYLSNASGQPFPVKVVNRDETTITFDANHEMAGKELNFQIELVEVTE